MKKLHWIFLILGSIVTIVLIVSGIMNYNDLIMSLILLDIIHLSLYTLLGFVMHIIVLLLFVYNGLLPSKKSVKGLMPYALTAAAVTVSAFWVVKPLQDNIISKITFIVSDFIICLVLNSVVYITSFYEFVIRKQNNWIRYTLEKGANREQPEYILACTNKNQMEKIYVANLSVMYVENYDLYFIYLKNKEFQKLIVKGKLVDYEKKLLPRFIKINRSTLINRQYIKRILWRNGSYSIVMSGILQKEFPIPKSRHYLIDLFPRAIIRME